VPVLFNTTSLDLPNKNKNKAKAPPEYKVQHPSIVLTSDSSQANIHPVHKQKLDDIMSHVQCSWFVGSVSDDAAAQHLQNADEGKSVRISTYTHAHKYSLVYCLENEKTLFVRCCFLSLHQQACIRYDRCLSPTHLQTKLNF
jgi:hypothetical protein